MRVAAWLRFDPLTYDGTYYLRQAAGILHGGFDIVGFPPGYPFAIALLQLPLGDAILAGRCVSLLAGLGSLFLAYRLARRHLGETPALIVMLFLAVHPTLARVQVETLTESLYLFLLLAAILWWEKRRDLAAGLTLGGAFLVRPEAILVHAGLLVLRGRERRWPWALAAGLVPVAVYAILASLAVGHPVLSPKQDQMDLGAGMVERLRALGWSLHAVFPLVLVPGACVFGARRAVHLLLPLLPLLVVPWFAVHVQDRIPAPVLPFLAILALGWLGTLAPRTRTAFASIAIASFALGAWRSASFFVAAPPLTPHAKTIGTALRPHVAATDRVAGRFPFVAYYAGAEFVRVERALGYDALVDSVRAVGATHLLVLESEVGNVLPQLRPLFNDARFAEQEGRMEAVAYVESPPGARAILYRFLPPAIEATEPVLGNVRVAARTADGWVAATTSGALVRVGAPGVLAAPAPVVDLAADPAGTRLAALVGAADAPAVAVQDHGRWSVFDATRADAPFSLTWVGDDIYYVRRQAPAGIRRLDPRSGRVQPVALAGLAADTATPQAVAGRGAEVAITYTLAGSGSVLAVATAPPAPIGSATLLLDGRWATQVRLGDMQVDWVPNEDALVASILLLEAEGILSSEHTTLCVVRPPGLVRRLTYGLDRPRRPVTGGAELAYLAGESGLHLVSRPYARLRPEPARVFAADTPPPRR